MPSRRVPDRARLRTSGLLVALVVLAVVVLESCAGSPGVTTSTGDDGARQTASSQAPSSLPPSTSTAAPLDTTTSATQGAVSAPPSSASTTVTTAGPGCRPAVLSDDQRTVLETTSSFILSASTPVGAIRQHPDGERVDPYLGSYAAMGLARSGGLTCDRRTLDAAWEYVEWYAGAMDGAGIVNDHLMVGGAAVALAERDSTDAYAGMFLVALVEVWRADPDPDRLTSLLPAVGAARGAIASTRGEDGLTRATPEWPVAYLMDQAEVFGGLSAAAELYAAAGRHADAAAATAEAAEVRRGVDGLWDPSTDGYRWAVHEDGTTVPVDWATAYPDAASQAFAAAWGLVPDDRLGALMGRVESSLPWRDPGTPAVVEGRWEGVGWWPVAAWPTAGSEGDVVAALGLVASAESRSMAWPFNVGVAGQLSVAATGGWARSVADS